MLSICRHERRQVSLVSPRSRCTLLLRSRVGAPSPPHPPPIPLPTADLPYPSHSALKEAFRLKSITLEDFWRAESCDDFWKRCVESPHPSVRTLAAKVRPGLVARELQPGHVAGPGEDVIAVRCKVRAVDPPVLVPEGGTRLLSEVDGEYAALLVAHRARAGDKQYLVSYAA